MREIKGSREKGGNVVSYQKPCLGLKVFISASSLASYSSSKQLHSMTILPTCIKFLIRITRLSHSRINDFYEYSYDLYFPRYNSRKKQYS